MAALLPPLLVTLFTTGCDETGIVVRFVSDEDVADGLCVQLDSDGATRYHRRYSIAPPGAPASPLSPHLPQTLTVLPGGHGSLLAVAEALHGGDELARVRRQIAFKAHAVVHVDLALDQCVPRPSSAMFQIAGTAVAVDPQTRAAMAPGAPGDLVVAISAGQVQRFAAGTAGLAPLEGGAPTAPASATQLLAIDLDGDCLHDLVLAPSGAPELWSRTAAQTFAWQPDALPTQANVVAVAAASFFPSGSPDLVFVGKTEAHLVLNDGTGHFHESPSAFDVQPTDATSVAVGDLNGDGHLDIVIGQGSLAPGQTRVYLNDSKGTGHFTYSAASLPVRLEMTTAVALADLDGDGALDLVAAHRNAPMRIYLNPQKDGHLEDRSFSNLPDQLAGDVESVLVRDINGDCLPDIIVPRAGAAPLIWLDGPGAKFTAGPSLSAGEALGVLADDVNSDGLPDLVLAGGAGGLQLLLQQ